MTEGAEKSKAKSVIHFTGTCPSSAADVVGGMDAEKEEGRYLRTSHSGRN